MEKGKNGNTRQAERDVPPHQFIHFPLSPLFPSFLITQHFIRLKSYPILNLLPAFTLQIDESRETILHTP